MDLIRSDIDLSVFAAGYNYDCILNSKEVVEAIITFNASKDHGSMHLKTDNFQRFSVTYQFTFLCFYRRYFCMILHLKS